VQRGGKKPGEVALHSTLASKARTGTGRNFMMADGGVRLIKSSINQLTYMSPGTRGGGEVVSADAF
jgi:hypothetical protein